MDSFVIPPILGELLMGCHGLPSAMAGRQVAGNGGFDVNGFHVLIGCGGMSLSGGVYLSRFAMLRQPKDGHSP